MTPVGQQRLFYGESVVKGYSISTL